MNCARHLLSCVLAIAMCLVFGVSTTHADDDCYCWWEHPAGSVEYTADPNAPPGKVPCCRHLQGLWVLQYRDDCPEAGAPNYLPPGGQTPCRPYKQYTAGVFAISVDPSFGTTGFRYDATDRVVTVQVFGNCECRTVIGAGGTSYSCHCEELDPEAITTDGCELCEE
ncbi:MAG: hypothetical protein HPKKFMNG_00578 [Planctomycetes bacterium]|nr:hypothetical protein [Planctomycetota bacterium]